MKKIALHWQILIAIFLAIIVGLVFPNQVKYIGWMGTIFLRLLKMIVVPLVFFSLVSGISNIGSGSNLGRIGLKTLVYYFSTSLIAILTGLFFVNIIQPGKNIELSPGSSAELPDLIATPLSETLMNIVPENIVDALAKGNMLSIIFFALLFGFFITQLEAKYRHPLENFFSASFEVMMKLTLFIIRFAPLGIFGIVAGTVSEHSGLGNLLSGLAKFIGTAVSGLLIHGLITLPIILLLVAKINPIKHIKAVGTALLTAFSTASSNATLPLTMESVEKNAGVSNRVSSFTLPLGATINMDGTALYELVVVGFVAQLYGIELSVSQQFIVVVTALLSSIGTAGVPMASFVTMNIIFAAVGLPIEAIAFILPIDRPLDMLRTSVNVYGDTVGASTIAALEGEKLSTQL